MNVDIAADPAVAQMIEWSSCIDSIIYLIRKGDGVDWVLENDLTSDDCVLAIFGGEIIQ